MDLIRDCPDEHRFVFKGLGEGEGHVELLEFGVGDDAGLHCWRRRGL